MLPKIKLLSLFLLSSLLLASCGSQSTVNNSAETSVQQLSIGKAGGNIVFRLTAPASTFNYLLAKDEASIVSAFFLMTSRLVEFDMRSQRYVPGLAETWKLAEDGKTVALKLRDGLKFSDGHELTADDVLFSLKAVYDERTNSPVFKDSMLINGKEIQIKKVDTLNLEMIFPEKTATPENFLANLGVLPAHILKQALDEGKLGEAWKLDVDPATVVCSGPFMLQSTVPGEKIVFKRNPHYWRKDADGAQLPYLDTLTIEIISDPNNAFAKLSEGSIDIADRIRPADFTAFSTNEKVKSFDAGAGLGIDHIFFNLNPADATGKPLDKSPKYKWFSNTAFRQAIATAIDRNTMSSVTLQGLASPVSGFVSPSNKIWLSGDLSPIEYSPEKAIETLKNAGFERRGTNEAPELFDAEQNRVEFTLLVPAENEPRKLMAGIIQQDLAKLGIKMQVAPVEFAEINQRWSKTLEYEAILLGLSTTGFEPTGYANFILSKGSVHQWHPNQKTPASEWEAKLDELFIKQDGETNTAERKVSFNSIQAIFREQMPTIPLVSRHIISAANTRVGNFYPGVALPYSFWNADELYLK